MTDYIPYDITVSELTDGALIVQRLGLPDAVIYPEVAVALREHFAAERMPEDVQALVDKARSEDAARPSWEIALDLADALEAAYSQKGADDDPR